MAGWETVRAQRAANKAERGPPKKPSQTNSERVTCPECGHPPAKTGRRHVPGSKICKRKSGNAGKRRAAKAAVGSGLGGAADSFSGKRGAPAAPLFVATSKKAKPLNAPHSECTQAII